MTNLIMIATYFGTWPVWFPAFLLSCAHNSSIQWLFFTDCELPAVIYPNIWFEHMNLHQLNALASSKLGFTIEKDYFSQVDLQPAYGVIFADYINGYDFWGHCDIDVVWGDIRKFITEPILQKYQIISCRKDYTAGHFTLWRNTLETNHLFELVPTYRTVFCDSTTCYGFDEEPISNFIKVLLAAPKAGAEFNVYWPKQLVVGWRELAVFPHGWRWENGKVLDAKGCERVYIHFQKWKNTMQLIDFQICDHPASFAITQNGIWAHRRPFNLIFHQWTARLKPRLLTKSSIAWSMMSGSETAYL